MKSGRGRRQESELGETVKGKRKGGELEAHLLRHNQGVVRSFLGFGSGIGR